MSTTGDGGGAEVIGRVPGGSGLCQSRTSAGTACRSPVLRGQNFCYMHAPSLAEERLAAAKKGGATTQARRSLLLGRVDFSTPAGVVSFIETLTRSCLLGQIPAAVAETCSRLAGEAARLRSTVDLSARLEEIERVLAGLEGGGA